LLNDLQVLLAKRLGEQVSIKIHISRTYEDGIDELVSGKVDFARFGPASYVSAKQQSDHIRLIAIESHKGKKEFDGVICVKSGGAIKSVMDLVGKTFAFGDKTSTIGRYLSQKYLADNGITAKSLKSYDYLDRHDKVATAVAAGDFDAGAIKEGTYKKLKEKGLPLDVIATFRNVTKPWISRAELPEPLFLALQQALLELKPKEDLDELSKDGFLPASDMDFATVKDAILSNEKFFK
jgi:phosphonate transport system substrate-binding protein